jgi:uncharacterized protein YodC (DUF2158 family)
MPLKETELYMTIFEMMKDQEKFDGLLQDICNWYQDHAPKKSFFEDD